MNKRFFTGLVSLLALISVLGMTGCPTATTDDTVAGAVSKTVLDAAISAATTLKDSKTEGTATGNVAVGSKATYTTAIAAAQTVSSDEAATQETVDAAVTTLAAATTAFNATIVGGGVSKTALTAAIAAATALKTGKTEGTSAGNVAVGSIATYTAAIAAAQGVADSTTADQATVTAAATTLAAATTAFSATIVAGPASYVYSSAGTTDIVSTIANWDSGTTIDSAYTVDTTYTPVIKLTNGMAWGAVSCVAFTSMTAGKVKEFTTLQFKINATGYTTIKVKMPSAGTEQPTFTIADGTALLNGWTQMSIPMSAFGTIPASIAEFAILEFGAGSMLITDVGFSGTATVDVSGLTTAITTATALNAGKTVGTANGNVPQAAKDAFTAAIAAAQTVASNSSVTTAQVNAAIATLATATSAFNDALVVVMVTATAPTATELATAIIIYTDTAKPAGATQAAITGWTDLEGTAVQSEVTVDGNKMWKFVMSSVMRKALNFSTIDLSGKTRVHFDIYSYGNAAQEAAAGGVTPNTFKLEIRSSEANRNTTQHEAFTKSTWYNIDKLISECNVATANADLTNITSITFNEYLGGGTQEASGFYIDNLYFY